MLGRSEGADPLTLESAQGTLAAQHSLLSRALQILTDPRARSDLAASLDLLLRVVSAVPPVAFAGATDPWLHFYEDFLADYDPRLRKEAGVYYTPLPVVHAQLRLIDDLLTARLDKPLGFADPDVVTLDPAAGTGDLSAGRHRTRPWAASRRNKAPAPSPDRRRHWPGTSTASSSLPAPTR